MVESRTMQGYRRSLNRNETTMAKTGNKGYSAKTGSEKGRVKYNIRTSHMYTHHAESSDDFRKSRLMGIHLCNMYTRFITLGIILQKKV